MSTCVDGGQPIHLKYRLTDAFFIAETVCDVSKVLKCLLRLNLQFDLVSSGSILHILQHFNPAELSWCSRRAGFLHSLVNFLFHWFGARLTFYSIQNDIYEVILASDYQLPLPTEDILQTNYEPIFGAGVGRGVDKTA